MKKIKCNKCKKEIDKLEAFSGGVCVDCYEKQFNKLSKKEQIEKMENAFSLKNIKKIVN